MKDKQSEQDQGTEWFASVNIRATSTCEYVHVCLGSMRVDYGRLGSITCTCV